MEHVYTLTLPDTDLIDFDLVADLSSLITAARQDDAVWAVVLDSYGDHFCLGSDPNALAALSRDNMSFGALRLAQRVAEIEKPVICAIQGSAYDQGLEVALASDVRIADTTARFRMGHILTGRMPWDGGTQRLPRLIGPSRAHEMLLTGRELDAAKALDFGIVNEVVEPGAASRRAHEIAEAMTKHGPIAMRYLKEAVLSGLDGTLEQGLRLEADLNFLLQSTDDRREGIESFLQRRNPTYRGQ